MYARSPDSHPLNQLSGRVIGCAYTVLNTLGAGFLEKAYENALAQELRLNGINFVQQAGYKIMYKGVVVGDYCVDLIVEEQLIVELKCAKALDDIHQAQCINYLKASGLHLCLLLNFSKPRLEIKRIVRNL